MRDAGEVDRARVNRLLEPTDYGKPTFAPEFVLDPFGLDAKALIQREYDQFVDHAEEQGRIISGSWGGKSS